MPCHVPATSAPYRRRLPSRVLNPPLIAATLDLSQPGERAAHDLLLLFSTGRWPLWRVLGMRRQEATLFVAITWLRGEPKDLYAVAELSLDKMAVCWHYVPSAAAARTELKKLESDQPLTAQPQRQKTPR